MGTYNSADFYPSTESDINCDSFSLTDDGLTSFGYLFDPHADKQLPRLDAFGEVLEDAPQPEPLPLPYWIAQCAFRGLHIDGCIEGLQERVRVAFWDGRQAMMVTLAPIERHLQENKKVTQEYEKRRAEFEQEQWITSSDEVKAEVNLGRFLEEKFPFFYSEGAAYLAVENIAVLKSVPESQLRHYADRLVLIFESAKVPSNDFGGEEETWTVVGRSSKAISDKICEIRRQSDSTHGLKRERQDEEASPRESKRTRLQTVARSISSSPASMSSSPVPFNSQVPAEVLTPAWNVSGTWIIDCPNIEEKWGDDLSSICTLKIRTTQSKSGHWQMWAAFNFIGIKGVFRFIGPDRDDGMLQIHDADSCKAGNNTESDRDDEGNSNRFLISTDVTPSTNNRTWLYYWRGEETSKNEVVGSNGVCCYVHFGNDGTEMKGAFESRLTGMVYFSGEKIRDFEGLSSPQAIQTAWQRRGD